jgi:hypothetical protein
VSLSLAAAAGMLRNGILIFVISRLFLRLMKAWPRPFLKAVVDRNSSSPERLLRVRLSPQVRRKFRSAIASSGYFRRAGRRAVGVWSGMRTIASIPDDRRDGLFVASLRHKPQ